MGKEYNVKLQTPLKGIITVAKEEIEEKVNRSKAEEILSFAQC